MLKQLSERVYPHDECLPILVLTADMEFLETKRRALAAGATDFLTKPFDQRGSAPAHQATCCASAPPTHASSADQKDAARRQRSQERTIELRADARANWTKRLPDCATGSSRSSSRNASARWAAMTAGHRPRLQQRALALILGYSETAANRPQGQPVRGAFGRVSDDDHRLRAGCRQDVQPAAGLLSSAGQRRGLAAGGPQHAGRAGGGADPAALARAGAGPGGDHRGRLRACPRPARAARRRRRAARDA